MMWFRMYGEFATDPKVQMLSEADQRRFIMLLCLRCSNGHVTLHDEEVTFQLRINVTDWQVTKRVLMERGLINSDNTPTNWDKRQFVSDSSAARVSRHRNRKKQQCNVTVTPPDTDTDTDTDTDVSKVSVAPKVETKTKDTKNGTTRGQRLEQYLGQVGGDTNGMPPDFFMFTREFGWGEKRSDEVWLQFRDYWRGAAGAKGVKADWPATWRNWCRRDAQRGQGNNGASSYRGGSKMSAIAGAVLAERMRDAGVDGQKTRENGGQPDWHTAGNGGAV